MSSRQIESLARRSSTQRAAWFGKEATCGNATILISLTAITSRKQLQEAGFQVDHDAIGRVLKGDVTFTLGQRFTFEARQYRIDEVREHPINPEWVLGLKQL